MRHQELRDNIQGSILKKNYLEAFLMQSAYLEGVLKNIADYNFFIYLEGTAQTKLGKAFYEEVNKDFKHKSLYELITFFKKVEIFDKIVSKQLNTYREKRNEILHDLVTKISDIKFEKTLEEACKLGNVILKNKNFSEMIVMLEEIDQNIYKRRAEKTQ